MKINLTQRIKDEARFGRDSVLTFFLNVVSENQWIKKFSKKQPGDGDIIIDVEFKVNGEEIDPLKYIEELASRYAANVDATAAALLMDKHRELSNILYALETETKRKIQEAFPDVNLDQYR